MFPDGHLGLEAISAPAPYCPWEPALLPDDGAWHDGYSHRACSPNGPVLLDWIRRKVEERGQRLIAFLELAGMLRSGIAHMRR